MNKKDVQHIPVLGDGDCLFHSITNYLHIDKNSNNAITIKHNLTK